MDDYKLHCQTLRLLDNITYSRYNYGDGVYLLYPTPNNAEVDDKPKVDIITVHGLKGQFYTTWRIGNIDVSNWPSEWLPKSLSNYNIRVISIGYPTHLLSWKSPRGDKDLKTIAPTILYKLKQAGVGENPVIFITHSMGGLLTKEILTQDEYNKYLFQRSIINRSN